MNIAILGVYGLSCCGFAARNTSQPCGTTNMVMIQKKCKKKIYLREVEVKVIRPVLKRFLEERKKVKSDNGSKVQP